MSDTSIQWTDKTWNPVRGCSRVSEGCRNCYAERMAARNLPEMRSPTTGKPFAVRTSTGPRWTGAVELIPSKLDEPLRWRKPQRVFVNSMSDLFHESLPFHQIAAVYGVMAAAQHLTFQVLTKRPARRREFFEWLPRNRGICSTEAIRCAWHAEAWFKPDMGLKGAVDSKVGRGVFDRVRLKLPWPLPNVWEGTSVEDQATADERIPLLLQTPAAVRFISLEPQLAHVDLTNLHRRGSLKNVTPGVDLPYDIEINALTGRAHDGEDVCGDGTQLDWVIVGGESGPGARPFDLGWARSAVAQCKAAGVPVFVKQLGARPYRSRQRDDGKVVHAWDEPLRLRDRKGGDMSEWPSDLRVREFPKVF